MLHNSIPVLMYHHIAPTDKTVNVYPELFEDQLKVMSDNGWKTLSGDEYLYFMHNPNEKPKKCVLLTFDDGYADNYVFAYPLLKKYWMKAMLFIATGLIDDSDCKRASFVSLGHNEAWKLVTTKERSKVMCTWKELEEMEKTGVFDIQSHGISHNTSDYIRDRDFSALKDDLAGGKAVLEERFSKEVLHFAWPRGVCNEEARKIAVEAGYKALYTTDRGANVPENLEKINRLPVKCRNGKWLGGKLPIYASTLLTKLYLGIRNRV